MKSSVKKINVVLPVYNEEEAIPHFNAELQTVISTLKDNYDFEVIYVLDKSADGTYDALRKITEQYGNTKVMALSKRFGHQASLLAGINACDGDAVIMMDSDLEHPPKLIPSLIEKYEQGFDVVQTIRTYNHNVSAIKKWTSKKFYQVISKLSAVEIIEGAADFRLISKKVVNVFRQDIKEQNLFLRGLFPWIGFKQCKINFVSETRSQGKSKYNVKRLINFAILGIISFSKIPLRFSVIIGMIISLLSIIYGVISIIQYFVSDNSPAGWTSVMASVSFLGGIQLIFLGVIGEYIGAVFDEVKKRPRYIIEEILGGGGTRE